MKHSAPNTPRRRSGAMLLAMLLILPAAQGIAAATPAPLRSHPWSDATLADLAYSAGHTLVRELRSARADLDANRPEATRRELGYGVRIIHAMDLLFPYDRALGQIAMGELANARTDLKAGRSERFEQDLLPLYASLETMEEYAPEEALALRGSVDKARQAVTSGKPDEALQALDQSAERISVSSIYLPVDYVRGQLDSAIHALERPFHDPAIARQAIDNALVVVENDWLLDTPRQMD